MLLSSSELHLGPRKCKHTSTCSLPPLSLHLVLSRTNVPNLSWAAPPSGAEHRLQHALGLLLLHPVKPLHLPPLPLPVYTQRRWPALPSYLDHYLYSLSLEPVLLRIAHERGRTKLRQHSSNFRAAEEEFKRSRVVAFNLCFSVTHPISHSDPMQTHIYWRKYKWMQYTRGKNRIYQQDPAQN